MNFNPFGKPPKPTPAELAELKTLLNSIMADLTKLNAATAALTTATSNAVALIQTLQKPSDDQAGIDAATTAVQSATEALNAAAPTVTTGT